MRSEKIIIAGAGSIGTALGNVLAAKENHEVVLLSIEHDVVDSINKQNINSRYFPGIRLNERLSATSNASAVNNADVLFFAVPSVAVKELADSFRGQINPRTILVNLAKGYGNGSRTVAEILNESFPNPVVSFKGPAFARELINHMPTGFTVGYSNKEVVPFFENLFSQTCIYLDFSGDLRGVELVSILKNIYAIAMGIVDAHYNSPNLRFLLLTKAFNEIRYLLGVLGGDADTMFCYCGIGDFGLTALNDLSRNRTLGLLIGKGFFTETISDKVVLEGKMAINIIWNEISGNQVDFSKIPIFKELYRVFSEPYKLPEFVENILGADL